MTEPHDDASPPPAPAHEATIPVPHPSPEDVLERMKPRSPTVPPPTLVEEDREAPPPIGLGDVVHVYSSAWCGPRAGIVVGDCSRPDRVIRRVRVFLDGDIDSDNIGGTTMLVMATVPETPRTQIREDDWAFWADGKMVQAIAVRRPS